jgi:hypothetical protein
MATGVEGKAFGIVDSLGIPALSKAGPNSRVIVSMGPVGVVGDVVTFPPPVPANPAATATGTWLVGSSRVFATNLPVITQTAVSTTIQVNTLPGGPMRVQIPDTRVVAV